MQASDLERYAHFFPEHQRFVNFKFSFESADEDKRNLTIDVLEECLGCPELIHFGDLRINNNCGLSGMPLGATTDSSHGAQAFWNNEFLTQIFYTARNLWMNGYYKRR